MTRWGLILLLAYLVLGLGGVRSNKAATLAAGLTALVIGAVMIKTVR